MATRASAIRRSSVIFLAAASVLALAKSASADFKPLGDLSGGAFYSYPTAISADGQIIVGYSISDTGMQGFTWSGSGPSPLSDLTGVNLLPTGISNNGGGSGGRVDNLAAHWRWIASQTVAG